MPEFFVFEDDSDTEEQAAEEKLSISAKNGDVEEVKRLLRARGRQPLGIHGDVPLSDAVHAGHVTVVAMLLLGMADPCAEAEAVESVGMAPTPSTLLVRLAAKSELENTAHSQRTVFCALDQSMRFLLAKLLKTSGVSIAVQNVLSDEQWNIACEAEAASRAAQAGAIPRSENSNASSSSTASSEVVLEPAPATPSESLSQAGPQATKPHDAAGPIDNKPPDGCSPPPGIECWYESVTGSDCIEVRDAASEGAPVVSSLPVPFKSSVRLFGVERNVNGGLWLYLSSRSQEILGFAGTPLWSLISRGSEAPALRRVPIRTDVGATRKEILSSENPVPDTIGTPSSSSTSGGQPRVNPSLSEVTAGAEVGRREKSLSDDTVPTTTATPSSSSSSSSTRGGKPREHSSLFEVTADVDSASKEKLSSDNPMPTTTLSPNSSSTNGEQPRESLSSSEVTWPREAPEATATVMPSSSTTTNNEQPRENPSLFEGKAGAEAASREAPSSGNPEPSTIASPASSSTNGWQPRASPSSSGLTGDVEVARRETLSSDNPIPTTTVTPSSSSTSGRQPRANTSLSAGTAGAEAANRETPSSGISEVTADVGAARTETSWSVDPVPTSKATPRSSTNAGQSRRIPSVSEVLADVQATRRETLSSDSSVPTTVAPSSSSTSDGQPRANPSFEVTRDAQATRQTWPRDNPEPTTATPSSSSTKGGQRAADPSWSEAFAERLRHLSAAQPLATYEVIYEPRVAIRALPSVESELLGSVSRGATVVGTPYEVNDLPWLKLSPQTLRSFASTQDLDEAWILIDGRSPNLGTLLRKVVAGMAKSGPPPTRSSARATSSSGAKHYAKAAGAAPPALSMPRWKASTKDSRTDSKPLDKDGEYKVLQSRSAVRSGPMIDATIVAVAKQGNVVSGTPYLVSGQQWLRVDASSCENLSMGEEYEELNGAWLLIDGSALGYGRLLERIVKNPLQKDKEEFLRLDGNEEWVKQWQQWYALEVAKQENSHVPADKIEAYTKQLSEALRKNNGMMVKTVLLNRGALCRTYAAFDLAAGDLTMAARMHPKDAVVRFECGVARLEARQDLKAAADALTDFRLAQTYNLDPKYASAAALDKWIQRAKHWSAKELPNHYLALGVQIEATSEQLKKAHRQSALRWHPDKPGGDVNRFRDAQLAWEVLKSPEKRHEYDFGVVPSPARGKAGTKSRGTARR